MEDSRILISRVAARAKGLKRYYTGIPCLRGHDSERKMCNGACLRCHRNFHRERQITRPVELLIVGARARAREKGLPFNLKFTDLTIPDVCEVLGISIVPIGKLKRRGPRWESPSIDRIIPELGYVVGNVRIISHRANMLKANSTAAEMRLILADLERIESQGLRKVEDPG